MEVPTPNEYFNKLPKVTDNIVPDVNKGVPTPDQYFKSKKKEDSESPSKVQTSFSSGQPETAAPPKDLNPDNPFGSLIPGYHSVLEDFKIKEATPQEPEKPKYPGSTVDYMAKKGMTGLLPMLAVTTARTIKNSLATGGLASPALSTNFDMALQETAKDQKAIGDELNQYKVSEVQDLLGTAATLFTDSPLFGVFGKAGQAPVEGLIKYVGVLRNNMVKEGVEKAVADKFVGGVARKYAENVAKSMGSNTAALGLYSGLGDVAQQLQTASTEDVDWSQTLKSTYQNGATGIPLGFISPSFSVLGGLAEKAVESGMAKKFIQSGVEVAAIPAEASVFTLMGGLHDQPVNWDSFKDNVLLFSALKAGHKLVDLGPSDNTKNVEFTPEELKYTKAEMGQLDASKAKAILNDQSVPLSAKSKVIWRYSGQKPDKLDFNIDRIEVKSEAGEHNVSTFNKAGDRISEKSYTERGMAEDVALQLTKASNDSKLWRELQDLPIELRTKVDEQIGGTKDLIELAQIPVNKRTPEQQRRVLELRSTVSKVKEQDIKDQLIRANEAVEASKAESGITIPTGEKNASTSSLDGEKDIPEHEQRYKDALSKLPEADKKRLPTYKGKTFSIATVRPNGDIENVYLSDSKTKHRQYMKPEDADAYEQNHLHLAWYNTGTGQFIDVPQNGYKQFDPKVMELAASRVTHPESTRTGIKEPKTEEIIPERVQSIERQPTEVSAESTEPTKDTPIETKTQDNANEIKVPDALDVRQQTENGERMDEGNTRYETSTGESKEAQAPQEALYKTEAEIKSALESGSLTTQEYSREITKIRKSDFESSKERLRQSLEGMFTKQAAGDEAAKLTDVYDSLVAFIKDAIRLYGDKITSARDVAKYTGQKYTPLMKEAYEEATGKKSVDREKKMRGFPKRIKEFQEFKNMKLDIEANPELRYEQQNLAETKDDLSGLKTEELIAIGNDANDNRRTLAYIERMNRAKANGEDIMPIIEEMSKMGTLAGQIIRQFGELKGSSPELFRQMIEKILAKKDRYLTEDQKTKLVDLSAKDIDAKQALKEARTRAVALPTDANKAEFERLQKESDKAYVDLAHYVQDVIPKGFWDVATTALHGNLMAPISLLVNVTGNVTQLGLKGAIDTNAALIDLIQHAITGSERTTSFDPRAQWAGVLRGAIGLKESIRQFKTGVDVGSKAEVPRGFRPAHAWKQAFTGKDMAVNKEGRVAWSDRMNKIAEGFFGAPAETVFRSLNVGDKMFYENAYGKSLYRIGKRQGLKGKDLQDFQDFPPERFAKQADKEAKEAVFQEEGRLSKAALSVTNTIKNFVPEGKLGHGLFRFLVTTQMPYVKIPANLASQTIDLTVPFVPAFKSLYAMNEFRKTGKMEYKREAMENAGKVAVGVMIGMAAQYMLHHGLMTGSVDQKKKKLVGLANEGFKPNSINISGLERAMRGEDPSYRLTDNIISYQKLGVLGMALGVKANIYRSAEEMQKKNLAEKSKDAALMWGATFQEVPSYVLEQSFVQGTSTLLTAIKDKQWDYWMANTFKAITSVALPNTLDAANRATREYAPDLRGKGTWERLENVIRNKTWGTDDLPLSRNLWGEPILQNPEGSNGWMYQMFNVVQLQDIKDNPGAKVIYDLYMKTEDASVIPSKPERSFMVNNKPRELTPEEYEKYVTLVGRARKRRFDEKIKSDEFKSLTVEQKIKSLKTSWSLGQTDGKNQFLGRTGE